MAMALSMIGRVMTMMIFPAGSLSLFRMFLSLGRILAEKEKDHHRRQWKRLAPAADV